MPDQRGFAGSDRPQEVEAYKTDILVDDIFALADALGLERFALVGHDWGGAIAWAAALRGDPRLTRLAIVNAPHPVIFQKSLIESAEQRAASQYITRLSHARVSRRSSRHGLRLVFRQDLLRPRRSRDHPREREAAISRRLVAAGRARRRCSTGIARRKLVVPPPGVTVPLPDWLLRAFPKVQRADAGHLGDEGHRAAAAPARRARRAGRRPDRRAPSRRRPFRAVGSARRGRGRARCPSLRRQGGASAPAA